MTGCDRRNNTKNRTSYVRDRRCGWDQVATDGMEDVILGKVREGLGRRNCSLLLLKGFDDRWVDVIDTGEGSELQGTDLLSWFTLNGLGIGLRLVPAGETTGGLLGSGHSCD